MERALWRAHTGGAPLRKGLGGKGVNARDQVGMSPSGCAAWIYFVGRSARVRLREMTFVGGFWFARGVGYCFAGLTSSCLAPLNAFARLSSLPSASRLAARVEGEFCFGGSCPRKNLF